MCEKTAKHGKVQLANLLSGSIPSAIIHNGLSRKNLSIPNLTKQINDAFKEMGLYEESNFQENALLKKHSELTDIRELGPEVSNDLSLNADIIFKLWAKDSSNDLMLLGKNSYSDDERDYDDDDNDQQYLMIANQKCSKDSQMLFKFQNDLCYARFVLTENNDGYQWTVLFRGSEAEKFFFELNMRINQYVISQKKGKALNIFLEEIKIKQNDIRSLIFPDDVKDRIDDFARCFDNWLSSPFINRWGGIFMGPPGTGKTTIGSALASSRKDDCTVFYVPATDIRSADSIKNLYYWADKLAPSLIIIDDFDLISERRSHNRNNSITGELMANMDGLEEHGKIFTILSTNDASKIEEAIRNRPGRVFEKIILNNFRDCFIDLLKLYINDYKINIDKESYENVAESFLAAHEELKQGFTPDAVKIICQKIHMKFGENKVSDDDLFKILETVYSDFYDESKNISYLN